MMKRIASLLIGATITGATVVASAQAIIVSPDGPIKTLADARDAARLQRHSGKKGSITITVRAGTYYLPDTLVLEPEDSDTIWEARVGEHPVISGGRVISGWTKDPGPNSKTWTANAPGPYFHQLFVNGARATRARTPNYGFFTMDGKSPTAPRGTPPKAFEFHYRGNDIKKEWASDGDVEVIAYELWSDLRSPIATVDEATHLAVLSSNGRGREEDARYFIENSRDALDAQGEWYLDKTAQKVSYIPLEGENIGQALVVAPTLGRLVSVQGKPEAGAFVQNVVFRGLTFADADWTMAARGIGGGGGGLSDAKGYFDSQSADAAPSAIDVVGAVGFKMENCTITRSGGYGLFLGRGSKHSQVLANKFYDLGGGGVKVGEPVLRTDDAEQNYQNVIADNDIHDLGLVYAAATGIWVLQSGQNQIIHNHVHDLLYSAISVGWTWGFAANQSKGNLIAFNNIHGIKKNMLTDLGGIYILGVQPGTVIQNNLVHDISSFTYGGWGIYLDEGVSNVVVENNIVYDCKSAGFHLHYGNDDIVRNNIFAFNHEDQLEWSYRTAPPHNSLTIEHNIVDFDQGNLLGRNWKDGQYTFRNNIYYDVRGPEIHFAGKSFSDWQSSGQDRGSIVADPLFINAGNFDFRLRPNSPALKAGFRPIDMTGVGPRVRAGADAR